MDTLLFQNNHLTIRELFYSNGGALPYIIYSILQVVDLDKFPRPFESGLDIGLQNRIDCLVFHGLFSTNSGFLLYFQVICIKFSIYYSSLLFQKMADCWKLYYENLPDIYTLKLFIIPSWYPTEFQPDSGTFFKDWTQILHENGFEVVVGAHIMYSAKMIFKLPIRKEIQKLMISEFPEYVLETTNIFPKLEKLAFHRYKLNSLKLFHHMIQNEGMPDLVWFQSSIWAGVALSKILYKEKIPFIVSEHLKEFMNNGFSRFQHEMIQFSYSKALTVLASSKTLFYSIQKQYIHSQIIQLPNPVDEDIFTLSSLKDTHPKHILCIAHFRSEKCINILLDAFHQLSVSGKNMTLRLIGKGPLKKDLETKINSLGLKDTVKMVGHLSQSEVVKELHKSHFLVLPSQIETFGMALIEAGACGVPVVATKCGGPEDIVTSKTGILVEPGSVSALYNGLQDMNKNFHKFDRTEIRQYIVDRFGKERFVSAFKRITYLQN